MKSLLFLVTFLLICVNLSSAWIRFRKPPSRRNFVTQTPLETLQKCDTTKNSLCKLCGEGNASTSDIPLNNYTIIDRNERILSIEVAFQEGLNGYLEFRLCHVTENSTADSLMCSDVSPLLIGQSEQWYPSQDQSFASSRLRLPPELECERCVLQVKYTPGAQSAMSQFRFYDCALLNISHPTIEYTKTVVNINRHTNTNINTVANNNANANADVIRNTNINVNTDANLNVVRNTNAITNTNVEVIKTVNVNADASANVNSNASNVIVVTNANSNVNRDVSNVQRETTNDGSVQSNIINTNVVSREVINVPTTGDQSMLDEERMYAINNNSTVNRTVVTNQNRRQFGLFGINTGVGNVAPSNEQERNVNVNVERTETKTVIVNNDNRQGAVVTNNELNGAVVTNNELQGAVVTNTIQGAVGPTFGGGIERQAAGMISTGTRDITDRSSSDTAIVTRSQADITNALTQSNQAEFTNQAENAGNVIETNIEITNTASGTLNGFNKFGNIQNIDGARTTNVEITRTVLRDAQNNVDNIADNQNVKVVTSSSRDATATIRGINTLTGDNNANSVNINTVNNEQNINRVGTNGIDITHTLFGENVVSNTISQAKIIRNDVTQSTDRVGAANIDMTTTLHGINTIKNGVTHNNIVNVVNDQNNESVDATNVSLNVTTDLNNLNTVKKEVVNAQNMNTGINQHIGRFGATTIIVTNSGNSDVINNVIKEDSIGNGNVQNIDRVDTVNSNIHISGANTGRVVSENLGNSLEESNVLTTDGTNRATFIETTNTINVLNNTDNLVQVSAANNENMVSGISNTNVVNDRTSFLDINGAGEEFLYAGNVGIDNTMASTLVTSGRASNENTLNIQSNEGATMTSIEYNPQLEQVNQTLVVVDDSNTAIVGDNKGSGLEQKVVRVSDQVGIFPTTFNRSNQVQNIDRIATVDTNNTFVSEVANLILRTSNNTVISSNNIASENVDAVVKTADIAPADPVIVGVLVDSNEDVNNVATTINAAGVTDTTVAINQGSISSTQDVFPLHENVETYLGIENTSFVLNTDQTSANGIITDNRPLDVPSDVISGESNTLIDATSGALNEVLRKVDAIQTIDVPIVSPTVENNVISGEATSQTTVTSNRNTNIDSQSFFLDHDTKIDTVGGVPITMHGMGLYEIPSMKNNRVIAKTNIQTDEETWSARNQGTQNTLDRSNVLGVIVVDDNFHSTRGHDGLARHTSTSNKVDISTTNRDEISTSNKWDISTSNKGDISTSNKGDISTSNKGDISTSNKGDVSTSNKGDISTSNKGDISTSNKWNIATSNKDHISTSNKVTISTSNKDDISTSNKGDISTSNKGDISLSNKGDISTSNKGDISLSNKGDISTSNKGDISLSNKGDISTSNKGYISTSNKDDISTSNKWDISTSNKGNISTSNKGDISTSNKGDISTTNKNEMSTTNKVQTRFGTTGFGPVVTSGSVAGTDSIITTGSGIVDNTAEMGNNILWQVMPVDESQQRSTIDTNVVAIDTNDKMSKERLEMLINGDAARNNILSKRAWGVRDTQVFSNAPEVMPPIDVKVQNLKNTDYSIRGMTQSPTASVVQRPYDINYTVTQTVDKVATINTNANAGEENSNASGNNIEVQGSAVWDINRLENSKSSNAISSDKTDLSEITLVSGINTGVSGIKQTNPAITQTGQSINTATTGSQQLGENVQQVSKYQTVPYDSSRIIDTSRGGINNPFNDQISRTLDALVLELRAAEAQKGHLDESADAIGQIRGNVLNVDRDISRAFNRQDNLVGVNEPLVTANTLTERSDVSYPLFRVHESMLNLPHNIRRRIEFERDGLSDFRRTSSQRGTFGYMLDDNTRSANRRFNGNLRGSVDSNNIDASNELLGISETRRDDTALSTNRLNADRRGIKTYENNYILAPSELFGKSQTRSRTATTRITTNQLNTNQPRVVETSVENNVKVTPTEIIRTNQAETNSATDNTANIVDRNLDSRIDYTQSSLYQLVNEINAIPDPNRRQEYVERLRREMYLPIASEGVFQNIINITRAGTDSTELFKALSNTFANASLQNRTINREDVNVVRKTPIVTSNQATVVVTRPEITSSVITDSSMQQIIDGSTVPIRRQTVVRSSPFSINPFGGESIDLSNHNDTFLPRGSTRFQNRIGLQQVKTSNENIENIRPEMRMFQIPSNQVNSDSNIAIEGKYYIGHMRRNEFGQFEPVYTPTVSDTEGSASMQSSAIGNMQTQQNQNMETAATNTVENFERNQNMATATQTIERSPTLVTTSTSRALIPESSSANIGIGTGRRIFFNQADLLNSFGIMFPNDIDKLNSLSSSTTSSKVVSTDGNANNDLGGAHLQGNVDIQRNKNVQVSGNVQNNDNALVNVNLQRSRNIQINSNLQGSGNVQVNRNLQSSGNVQVNTNGGDEVNRTVVTCPENQVFVCEAVGKSERVPGMVWWCYSHCKDGFCPMDKCSCDCRDSEAYMKAEANRLDTERAAISNGNGGVRGKTRNTKTYVKLTLNGSEKTSEPVKKTTIAENNVIRPVVKSTIVETKEVRPVVRNTVTVTKEALPVMETTVVERKVINPMRVNLGTGNVERVSTGQATPNDRRTTLVDDSLRNDNLLTKTTNVFTVTNDIVGNIDINGGINNRNDAINSNGAIFSNGAINRIGVINNNGAINRNDAINSNINSQSPGVSTIRRTISVVTRNRNRPVA